VTRGRGFPLSSCILGLSRSSTGLGPGATDKIVDRILDWRGAGKLHRLNGATAADYRAAGLDYGPRNGPFQRVDELRLVLGMNAKLYRRVAPALTVYSGSPYFDPAVAPPKALRATDQMTSSPSGATASAQALPVSAGGDAEDSKPSTLNSTIPLPGRAFSIEADASARDGTIVKIDAVIRLTGDRRDPYWTLYWDQE
jgi:general secretion pathway protein K